jgi:lipopolysaccharide export system protein LptA
MTLRLKKETVVKLQKEDLKNIMGGRTITSHIHTGRCTLETCPNAR